ncbi:aromatic acid exporter family protein [Bacillus thermotolerans]|uniref:Lipoprotein n=1 Tax=Bacillus thermotolerans TaxID=1221996 RepID=A0A0F5I0W5_BACTR|nr:aromatic acid exporter family protein [Bacillus thermotolerans]KKB39148.1 putative lipoprotein [Bacillus thermotolerans]KKB42539.1 putative lipoprotein [Bacillus thermotolerans]KKB42768.1 putative lipoprotein [Bacillus thermotolerans]
MSLFHFLGGRILKTGAAVFITALICESLGWPPVFAVITAIVTIEPTAAASIKKGLIRFPASIIGAAYAMLFTYLFDHGPITFTLAAVLTILTCSKLKLYDGLLVATLTAIAMIEVTTDNYGQAFLTRLGTTGTGLIVSTLVNLFILPPDYSKAISQNMTSLKQKTAALLLQVVDHLLNEKDARSLESSYQSEQQLFEKTETLCRFQRGEWRYRRFSKESMRKIHFDSKKLESLRHIHFHIGNMIVIPAEPLSWTEEQKQRIRQSAQVLAAYISEQDGFLNEGLHKSVQPIMEYFWYAKAESEEEFEEMNKLFSAEISLLYELLAIFELIEEMEAQNKFRQKQFSPPLFDYR